ncbi:MAG: hypothetical protein JSW66_14255 [Phycisphaerales bacterium]|nr:MAG: hypothetical protein JSW66_14255 [Phycisphaerales bacterium]
MNQRQTYRRWAGTAVVICLLLFQTSLVPAQDITGEWEMVMEFGGRPSYSTLSISKNADGTLAATWGSSELSNVKFEGNKVTFVRTMRFGDREFTSNFVGTLQDGKLDGLTSSERGEFAITGSRKKPMSVALGHWQMKYNIGERQRTGKLSISQKADGTLEGVWTSERGGTTVSNVRFQNGKLTFDRKSTFGDNTYESSFEGVIKGSDLAGVFKTRRGEMPAAAVRLGAPLIGKWELITTSDRGTRTRTLTVFGDLTGRYESFGGSEIPIKELKLEGNQVTFAVEMGFGDRAFVSQFKGTLDGNALKGQMTSQRGTSEISGKKMAAASAVTGTWELTSESSRGTRTYTLKIKDDMTGTYTSRDRESPVTDLKVEGNQISFKITRTFNEREVTMEFKGTVTGTSLKGEFVTSRGSRPVSGTKID